MPWNMPTTMETVNLEFNKDVLSDVLKALANVRDKYYYSIVTEQDKAKKEAHIARFMNITANIQKMEENLL